MPELVQHGIDTVHIISPEPDAGKSYKIKSQEDFPDVDKNVFSVFPGTDLLPVFIDKKANTIQASPYYKLQVCTMPEAAEQHCYHQVDICPPPALPVTAYGYIEIILQPGGEGNMPSSPEISQIFSFVGGIKILWQPESEKQGHTYSNIGIA